jgi:hypothetical protein
MLAIEALMMLRAPLVVNDFVGAIHQTDPQVRNRTQVIWPAASRA